MKRKAVKIIIVALALGAMAAAVSAWLSQPPDEQRGQDLLEQALNREDYGFMATARIRQQQAETEFFSLQGRVSADGSQVSGVVLGQQVELAFEEGKLSQLMSDGAWVSHELSELGELGGLYAELLPASAFCYAGLADFSCQRVDDGFELRLYPEKALGWVGEYFSDPVYIIRCGPWARQAESLILEATEKVNGQATLILEVEFRD